MEENIEHFMAFTGATAEVAKRYLGLTENDAQQAIQLYFDSPDLATGVDSIPQASSPPVPTSTRPQSGAQASRRLDATDSDNEDLMDMDFNDGSDDEVSRVAAISRAAELKDDEAMARRMQEEMYAGGDASGGYDADGVRAPIGRKTETLVGGPGEDYAPDDMHAALLEQMRLRAQPPSEQMRLRAQQPRTPRLGVFNQAPVSSIWEENADPAARRQGLARATGGASESSTKNQRLAELFRPPFELMLQVPWDVARDKGKEDAKWILVNVQDPSFFDCQSLNRDIWKHEGIKELVKENFIFIQYSKDDPRGAQYVQYYFPQKDSDSAYPHIAIVDPRTGEQVKVWSGPPVPPAGEFLMQLVEFLDRYSLDVTKKNPVAKRKPEKSKSIDVDRLTEDEMLDLALKNSLANNDSPGPKPDDPDDLTKSFGDVKGKGKEVEEENTAEKANVSDIQADTTFSKISSTNPHTEPATGSRIQFRHPNGRVVRKFNNDDTVRSIYEWLKAEPLEGKEGIAFELKEGGGMGKETRDLIEFLDVTIKDAGLGGGTVMVEFLED
ncbi:probable UBX5 UBX (ubiquitin regulatory X) domain-containing protein [Rhynchosporium secalis]|uniref:Probable UBX5 UBX (Ubiquitin regulatory X) domain-containing protein n=1 Tax=Rhynchosporium secalis TaxID=38038 RepID=A0A1E1MGY7_RHYSE|nr:probable UBX5 UBX (ubiquitin regulatory X) domain-containing protein [Rhynchosporium secalis]